MKKCEGTCCTTGCCGSGLTGNCVSGSCCSSCRICSPNTTQSCTTPDGCAGTKRCDSTGCKWGDCVKNNPNCVCVSGQTRDCTTSDNCPGTQTCNNGQWGPCVKNNPNCPTTGCASGQTRDCTTSDNCPGTQTCTNGQWGPCEKKVRDCTTSDNCPGTQTCNNGQWGPCVKNDPNCPTTGCTSGQTQDCTTSDNCPGTKTCTNGQWGDCVKKDPTCGTACGKKGGKCCQYAGLDYAKQSGDCPSGYYCLTTGNCPPTKKCNNRTCDKNNACPLSPSTFTWPANSPCPSCSSSADCTGGECEVYTCKGDKCEPTKYKKASNESCPPNLCTSSSQCSSTKKCQIGNCSLIQVPDPNDPNKKQWVPICTITTIEIPQNQSCPTSYSYCSKNSDCSGGNNDGGDNDKYVCNTSTGACYLTSDRGSDLSSCEASCKFKCDTTNWQCKFDQNGSFDDKSSCEASCSLQTGLITLSADKNQIKVNECVKFTATGEGNINQNYGVYWTIAKADITVCNYHSGWENAGKLKDCQKITYNPNFLEDLGLKIKDFILNQILFKTQAVTLNATLSYCWSQEGKYEVYVEGKNTNNQKIQSNKITIEVEATPPTTTQPPPTTTQPTVYYECNYSKGECEVSSNTQGFTNSEDCESNCFKLPCTIIEFSINGKTNKDQNPLKVWVNTPLKGYFSVNNVCAQCVVTSDDTWGKPEEFYDITLGNTSFTKDFKISSAGNYSFELKCSSSRKYEDLLKCEPTAGQDCVVDNLSLKQVQAINLPFWREIIPVLPGFLRGLFRR
jgi:hypothetical protein